MKTIICGIGDKHAYCKMDDIAIVQKGEEEKGKVF